MNSWDRTNQRKATSNGFSETTVAAESRPAVPTIAPTAAASTVNFIPSATWQGSRPGFYFGTAHRGTGYYRDRVRVASKTESTATNGSSSSSGREPSRKRAKRSVQIAEDRNETHTIAAEDVTTVEESPPFSRFDLLRQAEQEASSSTHKLVDLTVSGVRTAANSLQRAIERNELQRVQYSNQPEQYMESEVALYEHVTSWKAVAADPNTLYPAILENNVLSSLVQLLLHDNTDLVCAVISVLLEWLDSSLLVGDESEGLVPGVVQVSAALLRDGTDPLVANLARLQPSDNAVSTDVPANDDEVGKGNVDILSLLENLVEIDLSVQQYDQQSDNELRLVPANEVSVAVKLCEETTLVSWLLQQIDKSSNSSELTSKCFELLALLADQEDAHSVLGDWSDLPVYSSSFLEQQNGNRKKKASNKSDSVDGVEILLQSVAVYRKKQPTTELELEWLENACLIVAATLTYNPATVRAFLKAQGIELVVRCLKERVHAAALTLPWLDFAVGSGDSVYRTAAEHAVQAGILKYVCPLFMGRHLPKEAILASKSTAAPKVKKAKRKWIHSLEKTTIRIVYALTLHLRDDSADDAKQRLLAKFIDDRDKCDRLVELCLAYHQRAAVAEYKFFRSDVEETLGDDEDNDGDGKKDSVVQLAALDAKLSGGGDILFRLAAICAFVCLGSKRCHERVLAQLHLQQAGMGLIRDALEQFKAVLGDAPQKLQIQQYLQHL